MGCDLRGVDEHGPEFGHAEDCVVAANAGRPVEDGAFGCDFDGDGDNEEQWSRNNDADGSENDVQNAFGGVHGPVFDTK